MKKLLPIAVGLLLSISETTCAQEQEKKLLDRIQCPDMQLGSALQSKGFAGVTGAGVKASSFANKTLVTSEAGSVREFGGTRSFLGIKNPWFGKRSYDGNAALLSTRMGLDISKSYSVKPAAIEPYAAASKKAQAANSQVPIKPFLVQGEAQGALQQISDKVKKEMTIDDVRELLNKPR